MGCGGSTIGIARDGDLAPTEKSVDKNGVPKSTPVKSNSKPPNAQANNNSKSIDKNGNAVKTDQAPVPKPVAFAIGLDGNETDILLSRPPPRRLQALEPLHLPKLSADQLAEKQRQAEEKREKLKERKKSASKRASRRRQELMKAKEFEAKQQLQQEKALDDNLRQAELKREARLREVQEKQRIRAERAKRAREKAKQISQGDVGDDLDVEKDDNFNADDDDSWLGDNEPMMAVEGEHGPIKRVHSGLRKPPSATTVDSYDAAFQRKPQTVSLADNKFDQRDDEFFGS